MKAILLISATTLVLATICPAQTCREVVRDSSGRVVQTLGILGLRQSVIF